MVKAHHRSFHVPVYTVWFHHYHVDCSVPEVWSALYESSRTLLAAEFMDLYGVGPENEFGDSMNPRP